MGDRVERLLEVHKAHIEWLLVLACLVHQYSEIRDLISCPPASKAYAVVDRTRSCCCVGVPTEVITGAQTSGVTMGWLLRLVTGPPDSSRVLSD